MKNRKFLLTMMLTCAVAMMATGCDSLKKEAQTEAVTEAETEAPTEAPTEVQTEAPTEAETETETEIQTEAETETEAKRELTTEEEQNELMEYDTLTTAYAADDINVREVPGTDGEIIYSYEQGAQLVIVGETPNWYMVEIDDYESNGFVSKDFVSMDEVEPKSEEERAAAYEEEEEVYEDSEVDQEFGVEAYAEPFELEAAAGANVRVAPAADGDIVSTISTGTVVTITGYTDRWYRVEYDGITGYVNRNLFAE